MRFILTLIIIFFILRLVLKPLLRIVIQMVLSRIAKQGGSFQRSYTFNTTKKKPEGTIEVETPTTKNNSKNNPNTTGEYIDFEVVK